jgi:hypothetical protein
MLDRASQFFQKKRLFFKAIRLCYIRNSPLHPLAGDGYKTLGNCFITPMYAAHEETARLRHRP